MSLFRRLWQRVSAPIVAALTQGLSPEKVALACALGIWFGIIPIIGGTMLLCALAAWALKLNHGVIQAANYAVYPLQFALLYPFFELGAWALRGPHISIRPAEFMARAGSAPLGLIKEFLWVGVNATIVWAALGLVMVPLLWSVLVKILRRLSKRVRPSEL